MDFLRLISSWFRHQVAAHPSRGPLLVSVGILLAYAVVNIAFAIFWESFPPSVLNFTAGAYDKEFWKNCLVNLHSSIFDFFILTILWNVISSRLERYRKIDEELRVIQLQRTRQKYFDDVSHDFDAVTSLRRIVELKAVGADVSEVSFVLMDLPKNTIVQKANMSDCKFSGATLPNVEFRSCILKRAEFNNFQRTGRSECRADLENILFSQCNLEKAKFLEVKLSRANFVKCDLNRVEFGMSNLKAAVFNDCKFDGASFANTTITGAEFKSSWPTLEQLDEAVRVFPIKIDGKLCRTRQEAEREMARRATVHSPI